MENCGASRALRVIASATARRIRVSGSRFPPEAAEEAEVDDDAGEAAAASTSSRPTRPPGPVPRTPLMSTPSSCARLRAAGEERTRSAEPSELSAAVVGDRGVSAGVSFRSSGDPAAMPAAVLSWGNGSSAVSAINAMTVATGALAFSDSRMRRTNPDADASISMFALSVSTSKRTSPFSTRSPSFLCHAIRRPSSIVRPSLGRMTRVTLTRGSSHPSGEELLGDANDVVHLWYDTLLEMLRIRDRRLETGEPARWRIEVVEGVLGHHRCDLAAVATTLDRLVHDEQPMRPPH